MRELNILQVAPRIPIPADDGGKIVLYNTFKYFKEFGAKTSYFTFYDTEEEKKHAAKLNEYGRYYLVNHKINNTVPRIIKTFIRNKPIYTTKLVTRSIKNRFDEVLREGDFDIIHCEHSATAALGAYAKQFYNIPFSIRMHNVEWMIWERFAERLKKYSPQWIYVKQQAKLLKEAESKYFEMADVCFSITDKDKEYALDIAPKANIKVSTIGVDENHWQPSDDIIRNNHELILCTSYKWIHNIEAVEWLIHKVLPPLKKRFPKIKLTLIGKNMPRRIKNNEDPHINGAGYVEDVKPYLNKAGIYVAPLFVGSGIRVKIIEALSMKLPVVATTISAEGIYQKDENNNGIFIADDVESFVDAISNLIDNKELMRKSRTDAREFVLKNYNWLKNIKIMYDTYEEIADAKD